MDKLEKFRERIHQIDDQIFGLIKERQQVSSEIGEYKKENDLPIRNFEAEQEVIERNRNSLGEFAEKITLLLIEASCAIQEKTAAEKRKNVLIIGGNGSMGQWAERYFASRGHKTTLSDIENSELEGVESADVILLATPIDATVALIEKLSEMQPKGLVIEIASLKSPLIPAIEKAIARGLQITSIHPMFGPDIDSLVNELILICGDDEQVRELFAHTNARLVQIPIENHDNLVCYLSGLTHFVNYLFTGTLQEAQINPDLGSHSFRMQFAVAKRVFMRDPELYYEILKKNNSSDTMIELVEKILQDYKKIGREEFFKRMEEGREYLQREKA